MGSLQKKGRLSALGMPALGMGCASLGNLYQAVENQTAEAVIRSALAYGMNYFDTAPLYGQGLSERRLGDVLRELRGEGYLLSTKVGRLLKPDSYKDRRHVFCSPMPFDCIYDYSYDGIMRSHEDSLQRLGLNSVDVLLVHDLGRLVHGDQAEGYMRQFISSGFSALDELRSSGEIKAIGLGVMEVEICRQLMSHTELDCFLLGGCYSLLEHEETKGFLSECEQCHIDIVLGGVYNSGILASGTRGKGVAYYNYQPAPPQVVERVEGLETLCDSHSVTLAAAALQFAQAHPAVCTVIPGLSSVDEVERTQALANESIPAAFWRDLRSSGFVSSLVPLPVRESE